MSSTRCLAVLTVWTLISGQSQAAQVKLNVAPAYGVLKAGEKQTVWVRVGLTGFEMEAESKRAPVNIALVLDKSGSYKRSRSFSFQHLPHSKETYLFQLPHQNC